MSEGGSIVKVTVRLFTTVMAKRAFQVPRVSIALLTYPDAFLEVLLFHIALLVPVGKAELLEVEEAPLLFS